MVFIVTIFYEYSKYKDFKEEELLRVDATLVNIYPKNNFDVLKLKTTSYTFFTSINKNHEYIKNDSLSLVILTNNVSFIKFLKGFYTKSILYESQKNTTLTYTMMQKINEQHQSKSLQELFNALFLAKPLNSVLRDFFANLGISHLIAISGFHLGVLSFYIYFIFNIIYAPFHQKYMPYRNKRFDLLIVTTVLLFLYLLLTGIVPSLFRAFIMFCMGFYLLRRNIKVLSFETLLMTLLIILALYPKYIFSISLWFSLFGVFYIFLFLKYFQNLSKIWIVLLFNFWIFASFNPIVHYFFTNTSYEQLLSPFITLFFTLFYPIELFAHFLGFGFFLDEYLIIFLNYKINTFDVITPLWFFIIYVVVSFISIVKKEAFIVLNILLFIFNIYLYLQ